LVIHCITKRFSLYDDDDDGMGELDWNGIGWPAGAYARQSFMNLLSFFTVFNDDSDGLDMG